MPQFQAPQPYRQPPEETKQHLQNDNVTLWLFLIWPVGVYLMWKQATWSLTTKIIITALFLILFTLWLIHVYS